MNIKNDLRTMTPVTPSSKDGSHIFVPCSVFGITQLMIIPWCSGPNTEFKPLQHRPALLDWWPYPGVPFPIRNSNHYNTDPLYSTNDHTLVFRSQYGIQTTTTPTRLHHVVIGLFTFNASSVLFINSIGTVDVFNDTGVCHSLFFRE